MTDILKKMWDELYDCEKELRTTRPTDPRHINQRINERIAESFSETMASPRFQALEAELAVAVKSHGEGTAQYGISRAMAHLMDRGNFKESNARFIRLADQALVGVANRSLTQNISGNMLEIMGKQIQGQWHGRLANGLRSPIAAHQVLMGTSLLAGTALLGKGLYDMSHFKNDTPDESTELAGHDKPAQIVQAALEVAGGVAATKWSLTGKILPGIHKIRSLG